MAIDRKCFVVVNPNSANGSTGRHWSEMEQQIKDTIGEFDWKFTRNMGDATNITKDAINDGFDLVVAVGGDGTNNEVINGFFDQEEQLNPECAFSFICRGTGGDFRKTFGWSVDLSEALERIKGGKTNQIDLGRFSYIDHDQKEQIKHFINITSFGIGGLVDHYVNRTSKVLGGKASFMMATGRALLAYHNQEVRLRVDDNFDQTLKINNVAIANGKFFGGGMMVAPDAEVDDGLFDVVILGDLTKMEVIKHSGEIYKGTHLGQKKIMHTRGKKVIAETFGENVLLDMDGEQPGKLPCVFEVLPKVAPLIV